MSNRRKDPHKTPQFWISLMTERLANPNMSPSFRARCEVILEEAKVEKAEHYKQDSLHYPRIRKQ